MYSAVSGLRRGHLFFVVLCFHLVHAGIHFFHEGIDFTVLEEASAIRERKRTEGSRLVVGIGVLLQIRKILLQSFLVVRQPQNDKFIAGKAEHQFISGTRCLQKIGCGFQGTVAFGMAVGIVDLLEAVNIEHHSGKRIPPGRPGREDIVQILPVVGTDQRVNISYLVLLHHKQSDQSDGSRKPGKGETI